MNPHGRERWDLRGSAKKHGRQLVKSGASGTPAPGALRKRAEERLRLRATPGGEPASSASELDLTRTIHELQVHQIQLEMQNEELKRTWDQAATLHETYLDLYDFAPGGYFTLDAEGVILKANLAGAYLFGLSRVALEGQRVATFLAPESCLAFAGFLRKVLSRQPRQTCDAIIRREGGGTAHVQLGGEAIAGLPECRVYMVDVTERRKAEEELARHRDRLEELARERTAAIVRANEALQTEVAWCRKASDSIGLLNERLQAQVQEAREANRELDAFSYSVSHDLRAPIRAIDGFARLLEEHTAGSLDEEGRRLLATLRKSSLHVGQLVEDLLAFARAGKTTLRHEEIDMNRFVAEILAELLPCDRPRQVDIRVASLPSAFADRDLVADVLRHLLSNAIRFSAGRPKPVVEVGFEAGPDGPVYFVRDNGIGFDARYASKLFGVFQRLEGAPEVGRTGIGLALVRRIVERHGGWIRAEPALGQGAVFRFSLVPS